MAEFLAAIFFIHHTPAHPFRGTRSFTLAYSPLFFHLPPSTPRYQNSDSRCFDTFLVFLHCLKQELFLSPIKSGGYLHPDLTETISESLADLKLTLAPTLPKATFLRFVIPFFFASAVDTLTGRSIGLKTNFQRLLGVTSFRRFKPTATFAHHSPLSKWLPRRNSPPFTSV